MTEENRLEKETGEQVSTKDKILQYVPGAGFSKSWRERVPEYMQDTNEFCSLIGLGAGVISAALLINYGTLDPTKWNEIEYRRDKEFYQEEASSALEKYDVNSNGALDSSEFMRFYQEKNNSTYDEWKEVKGGKR